jgi:uncharacterized membrane protein AbrB (regulator of aidB expression)
MPDAIYLVVWPIMGPALVLVGSLSLLRDAKHREPKALVALVGSLLTTFWAFMLSEPMLGHASDLVLISVFVSIPLASLISSVIAYKLWRRSVPDPESLASRWCR